MSKCGTKAVKNKNICHIPLLLEPEFIISKTGLGFVSCDKFHISVMKLNLKEVLYKLVISISK
jgi:hypothetical protein